MSEKKAPETVLAEAASLLDNEEFSWIRDNPIAARAYFMGLRVGFMEHSNQEDWNDNLLKFAFFQRPTMLNDWFRDTPLGKLYSAVEEYSSEARGDAPKQDAVGSLMDHLHEMAQLWRLRMERINRLIESCIPYERSREIMHQELGELDRQIEEKRLTARDAPAGNVSYWEGYHGEMGSVCKS
jgi:hypothetical protein